MNTTFGTKIKDLRKEKKLTQKEMAQKLSITISTLSHWECDYQEPSFKDLALIAEFFEVSTDYLLGFENDIGTKKYTIPKQIKKSPDLTPEEEQLLEDFRTLPRPEQAQASEYVSFLAIRRGNKQNKHA